MLRSVLKDLKNAFPDDLPPIETTSHLNPLSLPAQLCFYDGTAEPGKRAFVESSFEHPVLRANRQKLREWLTTNINVEWGKRTSQIEQDENGVKLTFEDGDVAEGDVLVGADGVGSQGTPLPIVSHSTSVNRVT